jgi:hypothetical protein
MLWLSEVEALPLPAFLTAPPRQSHPLKMSGLIGNQRASKICRQFTKKNNLDSHPKSNPAKFMMLSRTNTNPGYENPWLSAR